ncbi:MAG: hypothetical protein WC242_03505 [Candidatus Paceibacterota bacterium]|jgi:hypothetical protein
MFPSSIWLLISIGSFVVYGYVWRFTYLWIDKHSKENWHAYEGDSSLTGFSFFWWIYWPCHFLWRLFIYWPDHFLKRLVGTDNSGA